MNKLSRDQLWSLEDYAERRPAFRAEVIALKKSRRVTLGPHATLAFENHLTMKYQVQEMLRTERIFEAAGIEEELAAYNPLIPDGTNWKATLMIEFPDVDERKVALGRMANLEHTVWTKIGDGKKIVAIANEDMERSTEAKTAAVHFLRFELPAEDATAAKSGAAIAFGIDHDAMRCEVTLDAATRDSLAADLA